MRFLFLLCFFTTSLVQQMKLSQRSQYNDLRKGRNEMKKLSYLSALLVLALLLPGCKPKPEQLAPYLEQTLIALPTRTAYPTYTPVATYTPLPTYTKVPTYTPEIRIVTATFTPTPLFTPTETATPTTTPTFTATTDPLKQPRRDGIFLVGIEIAPGVWDSDGTGDSCYWEVSTATGNIISNHFGLAGGTVYIPSSAFQVMFDDCGMWKWISN